MSAPRRALVVIDVQNEYFTGNFKIEYPDVKSSLPNIERAMEAAQKHSIPVVVVLHILPEEAPIFAKGSVGAALHPSIAARPHSKLIEKTLPSCFAGTDFGTWLRENKIDTITVVGYMTHNCNESTIRQAFHEGYSVEFLHDASGSLPYKNKAGTVSAEQLHKTACVVIQSAFAAVLTTDEWISNLDSGKTPERDNVFTSNQQALASHGLK
eukprot:TRINITY_DN2016_c0_g1_i1.p1 TRINITY_DN2016_c0_g1~~TRINITY_DN2016_c0_g1_i1.p1  ORF type:complete len:211 (+),score=48.71 TRINITY_DN2016_c0_g1_i1:241-873(+)